MVWPRNDESYKFVLNRFAPIIMRPDSRMGKPLYFSELDNESRQRLIDVQQRGEALRATKAELRRRFAGSMAWKTRSERDYLYRRKGGVDKALGPRSPETEAVYEAFVQGKAAAGEREKGLRHRLSGMARVNKAMGLGRVPTLVARILRRLDDAGVLGEQVCVVGTNAIFAFEAHAGIRFDSDLLATGDIDVALDARRNLALAAKSMPDGLLGLLRKIDPTFGAIAGSFRAINASGLMVDLITPEPRHRMTTASRQKRRLGAVARDDVEAAEVPRLEMIVDAPRFAATTVGEDGLPVWLAVTDPRWWAAHKLWLASEPTREPIKRQRDQTQGEAVEAMLARHWGTVDLSDSALAAIPAPIREMLRTSFARAVEEHGESPEW